MSTINFFEKLDIGQSSEPSEPGRIVVQVSKSYLATLKATAALKQKPYGELVTEALNEKYPQLREVK